MKTTQMKKLLAASAITATLVTLTSCRVENISGFESVFKDVTGSASTSMVTHLASASHSTGDFKEGFKAGYAAGYAEAAKLAVLAHSCDDANCDGCDHDHEQTEDIVYRKPAVSQTPGYSAGNWSAKPSSSSSRTGYSPTRSSSRRCAGGS